MLVLGLRISPTRDLNILARMEKAGDVIIGPYLPSPAKYRCLGWNAPITLVHREPEEGQPVSYFGAYCQPPARSKFPKYFKVYKPKSGPISKDTYPSRAPLEGLRSVEVFYDENSRYCRGMLLNYQNGGCRAVGQCRIHVDPAKQFMKPSQICFRTDIIRVIGGNQHKEISAVQVDWNSNRHTHEEKGWRCEPLEGKLLYRYSHDSSSIYIEK